MSRNARNTSGISNRIVSAAVTAALFLQLVVVGMLVPETAHALTIKEAQQSSHRIAAGSYHSVGLRPDNAVAAWGANGQEQSDVPPGSENAISVAAGFDHSLALQSDGSVHAWGSMPEVPDGLDDVIALAGGVAHSLALKSDGTVVAWGSNTNGQVDVPSGLDNVVAIAAGDWHSLALKSDGTVVAWGWNFAGQCSVPAGLDDAVAIAGGGLHSLALRSDGTVVAWGRTAEQQCAVPADLSNVVSVAAGLRHSLALKSNGTVVAWGGKTGDGKTDLSVSVPAGLADVVAIDGGDRHSLALKSDGTFVGWGENGAGQCFGVVSADPADGAKNVPTGASITIEFSASAAAGASYGRIALSDKSGASIGITKTLSGDTLVVQPTGQLNSDQVYTLTLPENSLVDARSKGIPQYTFTFYTPDTKSPVVTSVDPPAGATYVPLDVIVRVYHSESILPGEDFDQIVLKDSDGATVECESGIGGGTYVWVRPIADLELDVRYTLTVPAGAVQDLSGNPLAEDFVSSFRTGDPPTATRLWGPNRYSTAVELARAAFPGFEGVEHVVIASGVARFAADPLAAAGLAGVLDAPLLLVTSTTVPEVVSQAIADIPGEVTAIIIGGEVAVPQSIATQLASISGVQSVDRVAGRDRFQTAKAIADRMEAELASQGRSMPSVALLANGAESRSFFDALALSAVSANNHFPILLLRRDSVPAATSDALAQHGLSTRIIGGGPAVVTDRVRAELGAERWAGDDRYATAAEIARRATAEGWATHTAVGVASKLPDALSGGATVGGMGGVLLLTRQAALPEVTGSVIYDNRAEIADCYVFGGPLSVSEDVVAQITSLLH